jgi:hypothetical protein
LSFGIAILAGANSAFAEGRAPKVATAGAKPSCGKSPLARKPLRRSVGAPTIGPRRR